MQTCSALSPQQLDQLCVATNEQFKAVDPNSAILPGIGLPSQNNGVCTITHTMGTGQKMKINGLTSNSPLANNALYSSECAEGQFLNLYEIMVPDVQGAPGQLSTAQYYTQQLYANGLRPDGVHFHWAGTGTPHWAVHHSDVGRAPNSFAQRTVSSINAFKAYNQQASVHRM